MGYDDNLWWKYNDKWDTISLFLTTNIFEVFYGLKDFQPNLTHHHLRVLPYVFWKMRYIHIILYPQSYPDKTDGRIVIFLIF